MSMKEFLKINLKAFKTYKKVLEEDPNNVEALVYVAEYERWRANYREAEQYVARALEIDPKNALAWDELGTLKEQQHLYADGEKAFQKALEINSQNASIWQHLGYLRYLNEDYYGAIEPLQKALKIDSSMPFAWQCLGDSLSNTKHPPEALYCWEQAARLGNEEAKEYARLEREEGTHPIKPAFIEESAEKEQWMEVEGERIIRLKKMVKVSRKLKISQIALILEMDEKDLYPRIVDWADQFRFNLDEDVVDFTGGNVDDFIAQLDQEFATWERQSYVKRK